jgi:hypothetical protein
MLAARRVARLRNCARDHPLPRPNNAKLAQIILGTSDVLAGRGRWGSRSEVKRRPPPMRAR